MISVDQAVSLIQKHLPDFGSQKLSGPQHDRVLAQDLRADRDYPPFDRVMMDGIAVSWNAYREGMRQFSLAGVCAAGSPQGKLTDLSTALEVMTGAPMPLGADLVIPYEHVKIENGLAAVVLETERTAQENVHLKGSDARQGDVLLKSGATLNGPHWGIAASLGYHQPLVKRLPKIAIISTGDELVEIDATPLDHQIRRSNAHALEASLRLHGHQDVTLFHINDAIVEIESHYQQHAPHFDLMIYSGGVSKGKFDFLPTVWKTSGVEEIFHGIKQRPGKPLWFGVDQKRQTAVMGLPGNPVSSLVCLHRYLLAQKPIYAQLTDEITFKKDMTYFVPVKLESTPEGVLRARPLPMQNSGEFSALAESDGFLELPAHQQVFSANAAFVFHPWRKS